jgi:methyl-accepting chemotaxis protein
MKSTDSSQADEHRADGLRNGRQLSEGRRPARASGPAEEQLRGLLLTLTAAANGDFSARVVLDGYSGVMRQIAQKFNRMVELNEALTNEIIRVERVVRREGRMTETASLRGATGGWSHVVSSVNSLMSGLVQPSTEVARVISAVADGDLTQKMAMELDGQPVKGEFLRIGKTVNAMVDQLSSFAAEVTRVAKEVGTDGKLGGQARVKGVSGIWKALTDNVNVLAG